MHVLCSDFFPLFLSQLPPDCAGIDLSTTGWWLLFATCITNSFKGKETAYASGILSFPVMGGRSDELLALSSSSFLSFFYVLPGFLPHAILMTEWSACYPLGVPNISSHPHKTSSALFRKKLERSTGTDPLLRRLVYRIEEHQPLLYMFFSLQGFSCLLSPCS